MVCIYAINNKARVCEQVPPPLSLLLYLPLFSCLCIPVLAPLSTACRQETQPSGLPEKEGEEVQ